MYTDSDIRIHPTFLVHEASQEIDGGEMHITVKRDLCSTIILYTVFCITMTSYSQHMHNIII